MQVALFFLIPILFLSFQIINRSIKKHYLIEDERRTIKYLTANKNNLEVKFQPLKKVSEMPKSLTWAVEESTANMTPLKNIMDDNIILYYFLLCCHVYTYFDIHFWISRPSNLSDVVCKKGNNLVEM